MSASSPFRIRVEYHNKEMGDFKFSCWVVAMDDHFKALEFDTAKEALDFFNDRRRDASYDGDQLHDDHYPIRYIFDYANKDFDYTLTHTIVQYHNDKES